MVKQLLSLSAKHPDHEMFGITAEREQAIIEQLSAISANAASNRDQYIFADGKDEDGDDTTFIFTGKLLQEAFELATTDAEQAFILFNARPLFSRTTRLIQQEVYKQQVNEMMGLNPHADDDGQ